MHAPRVGEADFIRGQGRKLCSSEWDKALLVLHGQKAYSPVSFFVPIVEAAHGGHKVASGLVAIIAYNPVSAFGQAAALIVQIAGEGRIEIQRGRIVLRELRVLRLGMAYSHGH